MTSTHQIIPAPLDYSARAGRFTIGPAARIVTACDEAAAAGRLLGGYLQTAGIDVTTGSDGSAAITLSADGEPNYDEAGFTDESYTIDVAPDGCRLSAPNREGLARAVQTFRQLLPPSALAGAAGPVDIACCTICDAPRFRWRGLHLDVCRHFFPIDDVKRFIDLAALHRYNRIHLHLTEDQGWRVQIERFPRLTEVGSVRPETLVGHFNDKPHRFDGTPHGGFYTQDQLRDLVRFASEREVVLVPEIDMPGHMQAAVAAYPEWGCTGNQIGIREIWGISQDILNVEESTVTAMEQILDELLGIFPSRFIHVGGDEVPKYQWTHSKRVQERMREIGVRDEHELQSWFIRRMDTFLQSKGRRTLGWDEILEGGLAPGATVMSWRGEAGGIEAAKMGHDVVMASNTHTYFDYYQDMPTDEEPLTIGGFLPTGKVYSYEPIPAELSEEEARHVLGAQGQLWSEYIPDRDRLDYMTYPRAVALAEVVWTAKDRRSYRSFLERLAVHRERFAALGVKAHPRP
ncbi:MAG: beta-N-acetylhexosaminidase [Spirochaetaceae bacterium]|nr:MAG: beta-N-acetylhexosaminidase [Spirochaetaceae bacterium]